MRERLVVTNAKKEREHSLETIIRNVRLSVTKPKEAPNQTMEFFGYMKRVAIGVGCALGIFSLSGAYLWYIL